MPSTYGGSLAPLSPDIHPYEESMAHYKIPVVNEDLSDVRKVNMIIMMMIMIKMILVIMVIILVGHMITIH